MENKMKERITIKVHSFVDLITNSSTEMFMIDNSHGIEFVKDAIQARFPELMKELSIHLDEDEFIWEFNQYDKERAIKYLLKMGYTIIEPSADFIPMSIQIYAERGTMPDEFIKFIEEKFNGEYSSNG